jgi:hypothetical protein
MKTFSRRSAGLLLMTLAGGQAMRPRDAHGQSVKPDFAPGQEWSIKSASPSTVKVIIGKIETFGDKTCISISIVDIPSPSGPAGAGGVAQVGHAPFEASTLADSVDRLLAVDVPPAADFASGYAQWREARGGMFTISVEQAVEAIFQIVATVPK